MNQSIKNSLWTDWEMITIICSSNQFAPRNFIFRQEVRRCTVSSQRQNVREETITLRKWCSLKLQSKIKAMLAFHKVKWETSQHNRLRGLFRVDLEIYMIKILTPLWFSDGQNRDRVNPAGTKQCQWIKEENLRHHVSWFSLNLNQNEADSFFQQNLYIFRGLTDSKFCEKQSMCQRFILLFNPCFSPSYLPPAKRDALQT